MMYTLRAATAADKPFLWQLHCATMREYVARTWGWDEEAQATKFEQSFAARRWQIVVVDGRDAGALCVERRPDAIYLSRIQVQPGYQGRGLGTAIVRALLAETAHGGVPVTLRVLKVNPAQRLYQRLGFAITEESATHIMMSASCRGT